MSRHLRACVQCHRHILISERACPFCGGTVPEERRCAPALGTPAGRLGRALAVSSLAAAGSLGAAHCASETAPVVNSADGYGTGGFSEADASQQDVATEGDAVAPDVVIGAEAAYGAVWFPEPDAGQQDGPEILTGEDAYGAVPFPEPDASAPDASAPDAAGDGADAAEQDSGEGGGGDAEPE